MAEEAWHAPRLIPTSGIGGADEQERRATSALLTVMEAVAAFGRALTRQTGAPTGTVECFVDVPFEVGDREVYPAGLIRVQRGKTAWTALVEVKTGRNHLQRQQLETLLDIAGAEGFDALITISNEIPAIANTHPTAVDRRRLRKVALHHFSWTLILTEAVTQKARRNVSHPDQAWILGELIRYLEDPLSGAMEFEDMGGSWVTVCKAAATGNLRSSDGGVDDVARRWDQLICYAALRLGRRLGTDVETALSRREQAHPAARTQAVAVRLAQRGLLQGGLRIPDAVGPLMVTADLHANRLTTYVDIDAPREGRPEIQVNWLARQLRSAPDNLRIDAFALHARTSALLGRVLEDPTVLLDSESQDLKSFRIRSVRPLGAKQGHGRGTFVTSVLDAVDAFYCEVVQNLKAWGAHAPRPRGPERAEEKQHGVATSTPNTWLVMGMNATWRPAPTNK